MKKWYNMIAIPIQTFLLWHSDAFLPSHLLEPRHFQNPRVEVPQGRTQPLWEEVWKSHVRRRPNIVCRSGRSETTKFRNFGSTWSLDVCKKLKRLRRYSEIDDVAAIQCHFSDGVLWYSSPLWNINRLRGPGKWNWKDPINSKHTLLRLNFQCSFFCSAYFLCFQFRSQLESKQHIAKSVAQKWLPSRIRGHSICRAVQQELNAFHVPMNLWRSQAKPGRTHKVDNEVT